MSGKDMSPSGEGDMNMMTPTQQDQLLDDEKPNEEVEETAQNDLKQLNHKAKVLKARLRPQKDTENSRQAMVVGQLKAAEARNRNRLRMLRFQAMRARDINQLINSQPTAREAIRLEVFLPPREDMRSPPDPLDRTERARVESILMDEMGLTINRTM